MEERILSKLREIEKEEKVRILLAVESGSRAWGFASPDSDYDVRFIYARKKEEYLRLDPMRDVIEMPLDNVLDINGWDLQKTLRLLYKSNPTVFEWFLSPIIYLETDFGDELRRTMQEYFSTKRSMYHYINMAEGNYREYLKGEMVRAKKYFYVLRPLLACQWILEEGTPPPMKFSELMNAKMPGELEKEINTLIKLKISSPEIKEIPRIDRLNAYLDESINELKGMLQSLREEKKMDWKELNQLFLRFTM